MSTPTETINPLWRRLALAFWALIALAFLAFFVLESRLDFLQIQEACQGPECNWMALSTAEIEALQAWGLTTQAFAAFMIGTAAIFVAVYWMLGGLILWRDNSTAGGLAISLALLVIPITMISDSDNLYASYPDLLVPSVLLQSLGSVFLLLFVYLFPNGRIYPRWAVIPLVGTLLVFVAADFAEFFGFRLTSAQNAVFLALIPLFFIGFALQVVRYRRDSSPIERQQTKWALLGFMCLFLGFPLWGVFFGGLAEIPPGEARLWAVIGGWLLIMLLVAGLPVTLAIAILRYRLWDIDLIIRRTLIYGLLTALLVLIYFGLVTLLQNLVTGLTGQQSPVIIVLSTLAIAALFNPLRRRIQDFIDRRFYRRKYDAERALADFGQTVREEVDLESLTRELLAVVDETMQPESVAVWIKERAE
ncbi:MAG: hypothetical protein R3335_10785 [Anaerolineales bacterium]|nr:hypothetical protein [Anaerolineales bacterium]